MKFYKTEFTEKSDKKAQPETEAAIVKSIILQPISERLNKLFAHREQIERDHGPREIIEDIKKKVYELEYLKDLVESVPDVLYTVKRTTSEVIEIKGLDGRSFELSLLRNDIGGSIYQLKDSKTKQIVEIIEFDYLNEVEKACRNGYLIPDSNLSKALAQLRKED